MSAPLHTLHLQRTYNTHTRTPERTVSRVRAVSRVLGAHSAYVVGNIVVVRGVPFNARTHPFPAPTQRADNVRHRLLNCSHVRACMFGSVRVGTSARSGRRRMHIR